MPSHSDALGYLNDLAKEVGQTWFTMICDLAGVSGMSTLDLKTQEVLIALYRSKASYFGIKSAATSPAAIATTSSPDFLEELSGFTNFKLLGSTLRVRLKKRITLIFGANGSGKSSLCESLKVLASPELPTRPLNNVRGTGTAMPAFQYKFKSDPTVQPWTQMSGYGLRQAAVKYFDTGIAIKNVKNPVEPGRIIVLTPFKLHVFEWATALTTKFREALLQEKQEASAELGSALEEIRTEFGKFNGHPLAVIDETTSTVIPSQIDLGECFTDDILLSEKQRAASELEKASSEDGLKLLKAEHRDLELLLSSVGTLLGSAESLWALEPVTKGKNLEARQTEQAVLAKILIPTGGTLEGVLTLLRAAAPLCKFDAAAGHMCPLCKRDLGNSEVELFRLYHGLLVDGLESDITALKADIAKAGEFADVVRNVSREEWDKSPTLQNDILTTAKTASDLIIANCEVTKEPTEEARAALESLRSFSIAWAQQMETKAKAITTATVGTEELAKQLATFHAEIEPLEYAGCIRSHLEKVKEAQRLATEVAFWDDNLPAFTPLLKKLTDRAKEAHEGLVVADFERLLNAEYSTLTQKDMSAFGVTLAKKGTEASVTVLPQIGGKEIEGVLSEGEQRVHALALFFAELETCPQSVLIFDDPVSSFDYNYISNYCFRLRDFTLAHLSSQIIVLTHNWEFFVQLQTVLNACGLNGQFSVQVLENCAVVDDYSEKTDELKTAITATLAVPIEPTKAQKEEMAGKMRRLIEAIVNTHVFNQQRHQYKQKNQPVSHFHEFTKLVPLLPTEATKLRDLYAQLSTTEHDDPTNAYVNTDKAMFQTRYDNIIAIESAVILRK